MTKTSHARKRISIRNLKLGMEIIQAFDKEDRLITGDLTIQNELDKQRLQSLGVQYLIFEQKLSQAGQESSEYETPTDSIVTEQSNGNADAYRESKKVYKQLSQQMKKGFFQLQEGSSTLSDFSKLQPYINKFIRLANQSTSSISILSQVEQNYDVTHHHSINVCLLGILYGKAEHFPREDLEDFAFGCLCHDLGMAKIPEAIIRKEGSLSSRERNQVKEHPLMGARLLLEEYPDKIYGKMAYEHHERPDGSGYPDGEQSIHRFSQILSVIDVYEALTAPRAYKTQTIPLRAYHVLQDEFYSAPETRNIVNRLIQCLGIFPVGSVVRLTDNCLAVIQKNNPEHFRRPVVSVITDEAEEIYSKPFLLDLEHVYRQSVCFRNRIYDDQTAIKSIVLPNPRKELIGKINTIYEGYHP